MNKFDLDYNSCDNEGNTYLHNAAAVCMTDVCKLLLHTMSNEFINKQNNKGLTALHYALCRDDEDLEICKILLPKMSPEIINIIDEEGNTLLHYLLKNNGWFTNILEKFKFIFNKMNKETINTTNKKGESILHVALDNGYKGIVEFLINQ